MTKLLRIFCEKVCFSKKCFANFQLWNCNDFRIFYLIGEINSSIVHLIGTKEAHQMLNGGTGGTGSEKIKGQGTNRETMLRPLSEFRLKSSINSELKRSKVIKHIIDITKLNPKNAFKPVIWKGLYKNQEIGAFPKRIENKNILTEVETSDQNWKIIDIISKNNKKYANRDLSIYLS